MSQDKHGSHAHSTGLQALGWALSINLLLTAVQIAGGLASGSLALVADALHNFSDAGALAIALIARAWAARAADSDRTYGYGRTELIGAMINLTTLVIIGLYLVYEAILRWFNPEPIAGWLVVAVAGVALVIDLATAALTYRLSHESANIRAAFVHNVADALSSVAVIVAGALIILYGWVRADAVCTLLVSAYVLYHGMREIRPVIRILMQSTPKDIDLRDLATSMELTDGVLGTHHLHVWQVDEHSRSLEAHIVIRNTTQQDQERIKVQLKQLIAERFNITHSTLEFEFPDSTACTDGIRDRCHDITH